ncbi:glycosyltransferase, partial [Bordetella pertussis]|uniref:glycosyltransferase n=1 Tax=Bordetella pertussis TaxID=520 RepID=UPI003879C919
AVGRLHPDKGFDVLIDAYARIAPRYPDWDLVILGEGRARSCAPAWTACWCGRRATPGPWPKRWP